MKKFFPKLIFISILLFTNIYVYGSSYVDNRNDYSFIDLFGYTLGSILVILAIIFLTKVLAFKLSKMTKSRKIKIIDILNMNGIKILVTEIYGKYYILAFNNNSIILVDKLENIEFLESNGCISYENSFDKQLEKILKKINSIKNTRSR